MPKQIPDLQGSVEVKITAPNKMNLEEITKFAYKKIDWIKKNYQKILQRKSVNFLPKKRGAIYFLNKEFVIKIIKNCEKNNLEIVDNLLIINLKKGASTLEKTALIKNWRIKEFQKILTILFAKWQKIIGVEISQFKIREMKTRFGTCNIRTKKIWISLMLSEKSLEIIEYVVVHELVHLLERRHNQNFKNHLTKFLPNWRETEGKLKGKIF